ncbi:Contains similarity to protein kinase F6N23.2 gi/7488262 from Arabidopsis thaliana BAC F6N23 gb/AF058919 [Arabidopsis thaliana]|nr:Contains similarity to protein kinase F6N23.2 gi/7488262 from Arabidopsis thaliana BAC F6N23 gb/AF058919 [Arabidopsis thaliana]
MLLLLCFCSCRVPWKRPFTPEITELFSEENCSSCCAETLRSNLGWMLFYFARRGLFLRLDIDVSIFAIVSGPDEEDNRSEFLLKQYDYFGVGLSGNVHSADIVAMSQVFADF